jgi:hypothetical protein
MKHLRLLVPIVLAVMLLVLGGAVASATGVEPVGTPYVDNAPHSIAPNTEAWYRFEYNGKHDQILVRLVNARDDGLGFQVFTPNQMDEWWKNDGIGMGSPQGDDLIWSGNSHESGTWFVRLTNEKAIPQTFTLEVTGEGVSLTPPAVVVPQVQSVVVPPLSNVEPGAALLLDSTAKVIPANTTLWYRFPYNGTNDQVILKIPKGWENHLQMRIHAPSQMNKWWSSEVKPVGQGTPRNEDLVWSGNSNEAGWWYVEVRNINPTDVGFTFETEYLERADQVN